MKIAAKVLAGVALIAAVWSGVFLYWHVRILRAVRALEEESGHIVIEYSEAESILTAAGCRSLPYLIDSLDDSKKFDFLYRCSFLVCWESVHPGALPAESSSEVLSERLGEWCISLKDDAAVRRRKCDLIKTWWRSHGGERHQWWRVWTSACAP
jgi:hypothetical protein